MLNLLVLLEIVISMLIILREKTKERVTRAESGSNTKYSRASQRCFQYKPLQLYYIPITPIYADLD